MDFKQARTLYDAAYQAAQGVGFALSRKPLELKPQDKLVEIVRESQKLALALEGGDEQGAGQNESRS
jgi:CRISPR-associated protein Csb1